MRELPYLLGGLVAGLLYQRSAEWGPYPGLSPGLSARAMTPQEILNAQKIRLEMMAKWNEKRKKEIEAEEMREKLKQL